MLKKITFQNYKAFGQEETIELRPITLIVGKNSSGKSSVLKLLSMLQTATDVSKAVPQLRLVNKYVSLGSRYEDLFYNHQQTGLSLGLLYDHGLQVKAEYLIDKGKLYRYAITTSFSGEEVSNHNISMSETGLIDSALRQADPQVYQDIGFDVDYIGPIRRDPERTIDFEGYNDYSYVGFQGEFGYQILLDSYLRDHRLYDQVSDWLYNHLEGQRLVIEQMNPMSGSYGFYIERNGCKVNLADVGEGVAQLLPIVVEANIDHRGKIVVIEQPELHVHPADHADIAYLLADAAKRNDNRIVVESHSANMLLAFRDLVSDKTKDFTSDDIIVYFVDRDDKGAFLQTITINENGELSQWPTGVFGESFELISKILKNQEG